MYLVIKERNNAMPRTLMDHKFLFAYRRNFSFIELKLMRLSHWRSYLSVCMQ